MRFLINCLICLWTICIPTLALADSSVLSNLGLDQPAGQTLSADEAFHLSTQIEPDAIVLSWKIAPGYYLYQNRIQFSLQHANQTQIYPVHFPTAKTIDDPYFGHVAVYYDQLQLRIKLAGPIEPDMTLTVSWQGCSGKLCYPKQKQTLALKGTGLKDTPLLSARAVLIKQPEQAATLMTNDALLTQHLSTQHPFWSIAILFGLGILLSFTPCVLPMIPVLSSIIVGQKDRRFLHALGLSTTYVLGVAVVYSLLGLLMVSLGARVQTAIQQPWVITVFAAIFALLALSMFDWYQVQLPKGIQQKLLQWQTQYSHVSAAQTFLAGAVSALVLSPCTSAPLVGTLGFISQSGSQLFGAAALFAMGIGMGMPLILISVGAGRILPKAGPWMMQIKRLFGLLLIAVSLYLIDRVWPHHVTLIAAGGILILYAITNPCHRSKVLYALRWIVVLYGILLITGGVMGHTNFLKPLSASTKGPALPWNKVTTQWQLQQALAHAQQTQRPVLVDFYADWCLECRRMAATTFTNTDLQHTLTAFTLIKADVSTDSKASNLLLAHNQILGLPTLLVYDSQGSLVTRLVGEQSAPALIAQLSRLR